MRSPLAKWKIFSKNPLTRMSIDELRETEARLKLEAASLNSEIQEIETDIQGLFEKSKNIRNRQEEISIANEIKTLVQKKEMKVAAHAQGQKELRAVANMLIIKEHEADLRKGGAWDKLKKVPPGQLERYLIESKLESEDQQVAVKMVTELTSSMIKPDEYTEGLEDILKVMHEVKKEGLAPEAAKDKIVKIKPLEQ